MSRKTILFALVLIVNSFLFSQYAKNDSYFGLTLGTNGIGAQLGYTINPRINLRISSSYLSTDYSDDFIERKNLINTGDFLMNKWNINVSSVSIGTLIDIKPFINSEFVRVSLGVFYNSFTANYNSNYSYSDTKKGLNFDAGTLKLNVTTAPIKPYIGLLLGTPSDSKRVNFSIEMGTMFQQSPNARFTGEGMVGPTASQEPIVQKNVSNYNFYPTLSFQLNYRFKCSNKTESKTEQTQP
jgi:hypothetical protein